MSSLLGLFFFEPTIIEESSTSTNLRHGLENPRRRELSLKFVHIRQCCTLLDKSKKMSISIKDCL